MGSSKLIYADTIGLVEERKERNADDAAKSVRFDGDSESDDDDGEEEGESEGSEGEEGEGHTDRQPRGHRHEDRDAKKVNTILWASLRCISRYFFRSAKRL